MTYPLPVMTHRFAELPLERIVEAAGFYFRSYLLKEAGTIIHQHVHSYNHVTFVGNGSVRGWQDGQWIGDKSAGDCFEIHAGKDHAFQALEPETRLVCIHDMESALDVMEKGF